MICSEQADPLLMFDIQGEHTLLTVAPFSIGLDAYFSLTVARHLPSFFAVTKVGLFTLVDNTICLISLLLSTTENTITYHNAPCLSPQNFA